MKYRDGQEVYLSIRVEQEVYKYQENLTHLPSIEGGGVGRGGQIRPSFCLDKQTYSRTNSLACI